MTTARSHNLSAFAGWVSDLARVHTRALSTVARAEGLSADDALDVARELGLRPDHVATLLYRAKKELFRCVTGSA